MSSDELSRLEDRKQYGFLAAQTARVRTLLFFFFFPKPGFLLLVIHDVAKEATVAPSPRPLRWQTLWRP